MDRIVSGLKRLIDGPLAGNDRAEELNGRGLDANRNGNTRTALGLFLEAHVHGGLNEPVPDRAYSLTLGLTPSPQAYHLTLKVLKPEP